MPTTPKGCKVDCDTFEQSRKAAKTAKKVAKAAKRVDFHAKIVIFAAFRGFRAFQMYHSQPYILYFRCLTDPKTTKESTPTDQPGDARGCPGSALPQFGSFSCHTAACRGQIGCDYT